MISSLRGQCLSASGDSVVIEVGGLGLLVTCTPAALRAISVGREVSVVTSMVIREDAWTLYGFADELERSLFERLQAVSGVGPKLAVTTVGSLSGPGLVAALRDGDLATLTSVSGVGKRTAERMVVELRDKVLDLVGAESGTVELADEPADASAPSWQPQVIAGLVGLGWQQRDAEAAAESVAKEVSDDRADELGVPGLLKQALRQLDRV